MSDALLTKATPQPPVGTSSCRMSREERRKVLHEWNATRKDYPPAQGIQCLFEEQVKLTPDAPAVEFPSAAGARNFFSYAELNRRANQLAWHLKKLGVGPDVIVGICVERSLEMAIAVLAVIKAGGCYAAFDPHYPRERLEFMAADTRAPIILAQSHLAALLPTTGAKLLSIDLDWKNVTGERDDNPPCEVTSEHLAYLIYTSGSTGRPKGVAMRQGPLINLLQWQRESFSAPGIARTLQFASLNFDVSFQELFSTWCSGGTLVLVSEDVRRDSNALLQYLQYNRIERLFLPFVALKHLADAAVRNGSFPQSLKEVITAGEQLQVTPQIARFFSTLPGCTLENQYGPSESHVVTTYPLDGPADTWPPLPSIGRPIANVKIYILDDEQQPVSVGETGELYIGGDCLARGYLNRPELTAERFLPDHLSEEANGRLYRTGDLARFLPSGEIEFLGRMDHQVKIRGYRIELGEIEAVLSAHPALRDAVVVARETPGAEKRLIAYVVFEDRPVQARELRDYLKAHVPEYAIPSTFVPLSMLPVSPNGKVDRRALPEPLMSQIEVSASVKTPRDPLEMQLALVFEKSFQRKPIGIDQSFFELGGDSLQALKVVVDIERVTGRKLPLNVLFQSPTVEGLASAIRQQQNDSDWSALVPLQTQGTKPPVFWMHTTPGDVLGYGNLIYHLDSDQPSYGLQSLGLFRADLSHTRIEEMAAYYLKHIRAVCPKGPYILGGWCYGGIVAVEMAHQLLAAGQSVAPLLLIETPAPAPGISQWFYYARRIGCALSMRPKEWQIYLREKLKYYRGVKTENEKRFRRVGEHDGFDSNEVTQQNRLLEQLERVYQANMDAFAQYRSRIYPGKIILFNALEPDPALVRDPKYGWAGLAGEIEIHVIPGNHDTILMEPHVQVLASRITACIKQAASSQPTS